MTTIIISFGTGKLYTFNVVEILCRRLPEIGEKIYLQGYPRPVILHKKLDILLEYTINEYGDVIPVKKIEGEYASPIVQERPLTPHQESQRTIWDKVRGMANGYNGNWEKRSNPGYFFVYNTYTSKWEVLCHCRANYTPIVYFKEGKIAWAVLGRLTPLERDLIKS